MTLILLIGVGAMSPGCPAPRQRPHVEHPDPALRIPGIIRAVEREDLTVARQLVQYLDSDDPAIRFYAIEALYRLTGQRLGYEYYYDEQRRRPAIERWRQWLRDATDEVEGSQ